MYQWNTFELFILLLIFQSSYPQRRIKDGNVVTQDKKYAVYLLRAASAPHNYHGWLCGGAIITKDFILTSAACVQDVRHLYVIPGYKKYVDATKLINDTCIKEKRKRVVLTCVPKNYRFGFHKTEMWAKVDIAVIKVESSFDFNDKTYETACSYTPQPIDYNTAKDFPKPGDNVVALGWGHNKKFRNEDDLIDMNQDTLQYASSKVLDDATCIKHFEGNKALASLIASSMLCTLKAGNINDKGQALRSGSKTIQCITEEDKLKGAVGEMCDSKRTKLPPNDLVIESILKFKNTTYEQEVVVARRQLGNESSMVHLDHNLDGEETNGAVISIETKAIGNTTETNFSENETEINASENNTETKTARNETEINDLENKTETRTVRNETIIKVTENKTETNIAENETDINAPENKTETRIVTNETVTKVAENKMETKIAEDETVTKVAENKTETKTAENETKTKAAENKTETAFKEIEPKVAENKTKTRSSDENHTPGICQNDHGGPLVAWKDNKEILVGLATLYKLDNDQNCMGPYLFTKTSSDAAITFIKCIVEGANGRRKCEEPQKIGFEIVRRHLNWPEQ